MLNCKGEKQCRVGHKLLDSVSVDALENENVIKNFELNSTLVVVNQQLDGGRENETTNPTVEKSCPNPVPATELPGIPEEFKEKLASWAVNHHVNPIAMLQPFLKTNHSTFPKRGRKSLLKMLK